MHRVRIGVVALAGMVVLASTALTSLTAQATPLSGGIGIRLAGAPTVASGDPLARLYIINRLAPGTSVRRQVEISNSTGSTADVAVYAAGASVGHDGFTFASGHVQDQLSSWTEVSRDVMSLLPGADASDTVTVKVPKDASSGENYAVIWAQVSAPSPTDGGVTLVNRVGVRMYVSIGLGGTPPPNFTVAALTAQRSVTGVPFVTATVHNSGQGPLFISGSLTLSNGPSGIRGGPFPVTLGSLVAPSGSEVATVMLGRGFPKGPWQAVMRLRSGGTTRSAAATLTFLGLASAAPAKSHLPVLVITALLLLLASAAVVFLLLRRRHRSEKPPRRAAPNAPRFRQPSAIGSS